MLTTKKFIKEVQNLGFATAEYMNIILIRHESREVALIGKCQIFYVSTEYPSFNNLPEELKEKLYNLIDEYTRTPIDKREEEKKYYLRFTALTGGKNGFNYLNYYTPDKEIYLNSRMQTDFVKTQFTQAEIDEIKEKFKVTLCDLEQIPVE